MKVGWLQKIEASWKNPSEWKKFTQLSRVQMGAILDTLGLRPEAFIENSDVLLEGFQVDGDFSDQHLYLSAQLFSWSFPDYMKDVQFVSPYLLRQVLGEPVFEGDVAGPGQEVFKAELSESCRKARLVLVPVHSAHPQHWCLLAGSRSTLEDEFSWRYRDTLLAFSEEGLQNAKHFAQIISGPSAKFEKIPCLFQQGSTCGFWTLTYAEVEICTRFEGPASRGWPSDMVKAWQTRVKSFWNLLKKEEVKLLQVKVELEAKEEKLRTQQQKEREKAEKTL